MSLNLDYSKPSSRNDYFKRSYEKSWVILHHTAGSSVSGAHATLDREDYIAVSYMIDKDGTVYEKFNPKWWAYALGVRGYPKGYFDKRAIQIELVNEGPLKKKGDNLYWWPNNFKTKFCHETEEDRYGYAPFRDYDYYASYSKEQLEACTLLCKKLCEEFSIPKRILWSSRETVILEPLKDLKFEGIVSHVNFRKDKSDIGSIFPWEDFYKALKEA